MSSNDPSLTFSRIAYLVLKQIQAIYREENQLNELSPKERLKHRQVSEELLVEAK